MYHTVKKIYTTQSKRKNIFMISLKFIMNHHLADFYKCHVLYKIPETLREIYTQFLFSEKPQKCLYIILLLLKTIFVKHFSTKMSFFVKKWDQPIINCKSKIIIFRFHTFSFCLLVCNVSFILSSQQLFYSVSVVL